MLTWFCCCRKKKESQIRFTRIPIEMEAAADFRPPPGIGKVYVVQTKEEEEKEDKESNENQLTIMDVIMQKYKAVPKDEAKAAAEAKEAEEDAKDPTLSLGGGRHDSRELKGPIKPEFYGSELVFDTVADYDAVFPLRP